MWTGCFSASGRALFLSCRLAGTTSAVSYTHLNQLSIPVKNIDAHDIQKEQLPAEMEHVTASGQALGII